MNPAGAFPLPLPLEARSPFGGETAARQVLRLARLPLGGNILEVGGAGSQVGQVIAQRTQATLVRFDRDARALDAAPVDGAAQVERVVGEPSSPPFAEAAFDLILIHARGLLPLAELIAVYRPLLRKNGRLALLWPTRVGRFPSEAAVAHWERRLGEKPLLPRELLLTLAANGLEPEAAETLGDADMDEHYRSLEPQLSTLPEPEAALLREELATHRAQNGKAGVAFTRILARRKEPGEKPPQSRDRG